MEGKREFDSLEKLLETWKLKELLPRFIEEGVNIEELQMMKTHHVTELLRNYKMAVRIRFEHFYELWRRQLNLPLNAAASLANKFHCSIPWDTIPAHSADAVLARPKGVSKAVQTSAEYRTCASSTDDLHLFEGITRGYDGTPSPVPSPEQELLVEMPQPEVRLVEMPMPLSVPITTTQDVLQLNEKERSKGGASRWHVYQSKERCRKIPTTISLRTIIQESGSHGRSITNFYKKSKDLTNEHRARLIQLIVSYFDNNEMHLSLRMSYELEEQILKIFPTERLSNYRTEKRGKIYIKFCNSKRYKRDGSRKRKNDDSPKLTRKRRSTDEVEITFEDDDNRTNIENWPMSDVESMNIKAESFSVDDVTQFD